ncbi:MAG: thioredoxin fold domain-containing protein [bacterium]
MFKKIIIVLVLSLILIPGISYAGVCNNLHLSKNLPAFKFNIVSRTPVNNKLCQVMVTVSTPQGIQPVPVYATKDFALIGQLFKNKTNVTQLVLASYQAKAVKSVFKKYGSLLNKAVVASYVPPKPNGKVLYAFEDPLCPFCDMMKPHMIKLANKSHYTIKLVWDIVHGKPAFDMATKLTCNHFTYKNYTEYKNTAQNPLSKGKGCMSGIKKVKFDEQVSKDFAISGTPTWITSTGKEIIGANLPMLKSVLGVNHPAH